MEDNLIALQESSKIIRNPFGFDFVGQWGGKKVVLKGDGKARSVIGPLANHLAKHLYMKVRYQFHDEQVAALKLKGDDRGAAKYRVPATVENMIWRMITGEDLHKNAPVSDVQNEADLSDLKKNMTKLEKEAATSSDGVNISNILMKAQDEAIKKGEGLADGETTRARGTAAVNDNVEVKEVEEVPVVSPTGEVGEVVEDEGENVETAEDEDPGDGEPEAPKTPNDEGQGEFPTLKDLD